jgi:cytoskeleton protein RodZ
MSEAAFAALASARQAAGLTLEEAARQLKFAPRQLEALEAGELRRLPGGTFVRGMVRSYARLLRIDPEPLLAQIAAQVPPPDAERLAQRYRQPVPFTDGARRSNLAYVALSVVLLVAVAGVALQWRQERAGTRTLAFVPATQMPAEPARAEAAGPGARSATAPSPAKATPPAKPAAGGSTAGKAPSGAAPVSAPTAAVAPAQKAPASAPPAATPQASPSAKPAAAAPTDSASAGAGRLALQFEGDSWVEIRSGSGKLLVASLHTAGTERFVSGLPPFEVVIGNAQQVRLTYNDKPVDLTPYVKVEVARFTLQ